MDLQVSSEMSISLGEDGVSMEVVAEEQLYCVCQTPWDVNNRRFMIHCDNCQNWFHGDCVDINEKESQWIDSYRCPRCEKVAGPSKFKPRSEFEGNRKLMNKRCSPEFRRQLKEFCFLPAGEIIVTISSGENVNLDELVSKGFFRPMVVERMDGLGLRVPPNTFTVRDIERYVEPDRLVDVIDVEQQTELQMSFGEFVNYFTDSDRKKLLNLISLEISNTKLGTLVEAPLIARKLDFLNNYWQESAAIPDGPIEKPAVAKYCLISAKDSYTDFHIDFGGTSVWYHILWGQKIFYLMEPTKVNLDLYNQWLRGDFGNDCFLPDEIQQCYRCVLDKGQTLFIPTGWIHAVYTPHDSIVFGGNFLHKLNMGLQLQIHAMERKSAIAAKYLFPNFETTHWFAAKGLVLELKRYRKSIIPPHVLQGVRDLFKALKSWFDEYETKKAAIPDGVEPHAVIKDLYKEIKLAEKFLTKMSDKPSIEGSPKVKLNPTILYMSADEQSKSSADVNLSTSLLSQTNIGDSPLGSPETQVRIKMKISRKSVDEWSPSPQTSEVEGKNLCIVEDESTAHWEKFSAPTYSLVEGADEDSLDCLYIDETTGNKSCKKWDTDTSVVSLESQSRIRHKDNMKHRHHKSKHKKHGDDFINPLQKHKEKYKIKDMHNHSTHGLKIMAKNQKNVLLNDALAGALDGMEELIKSSNYAERVAQSLGTPDAVKETIVGLGAMTDRILPKSSHASDEQVLEIRQVHQDDDYIYLPLVGSDDESKNCKRSQKKKRTRDDDDETWSPSGKLGNVGTRNSKVIRQHAKRKSVEKGLKEAASRPLKIQQSPVSTSPKRSFIRKRESPKSANAGPSKPPASLDDQQPSSSCLNTDKCTTKKWKKGMATPKQRLSKILKMGKFFNH